MIIPMSVVVTQLLLFILTEGRICKVNITLANDIVKHCNCSNWLGLEDAAHQLTNNSALTFCDQNATLSVMIPFQKVSNLLLQGYSELGTVLYCPSGKQSGLKFSDVDNLTIINLKIIGCGAEHESTTLDTVAGNLSLMFLASVYILNCNNVTFLNVGVIDSNGTGMAIFDANGHIVLANSTFKHNYVRKWYKNDMAGGGGMYIEFTYCPPGCIQQVDYDNPRNRDSVYQVFNCTFEGNVATTIDPITSSYFRGEGNSIQGLGRGGGLKIAIKGKARNNTVKIERCHFLNNSALWGGGLNVVYQDSPQGNRVIVRKSSFIENSCESNGGGGLEVGFNSHSSVPPQNNAIMFEKCEFVGNTAKFGGGTKIYSTKSKSNNSNCIKFIECLWRNNRAHYGSAIDILPHSWDTLTDGYLPLVQIMNCKFLSNEKFELLDGIDRQGVGSLMCTGFSFYFRGSLIFENNTGTALYISSCVIEFKSFSNVIFVSNTGYDGGAIAIMGFSILKVNDNSTFKFINNTSEWRGGAIIYISTNKHDFISSRSCFIHYSGKKSSLRERGISIHFDNNKAQYGQTMFATTILPCRTGCLNTERNPYLTRLGLGCIGDIIYTNRSGLDVSTVGANFSISKASDAANAELSPFSGQVIDLQFTLQDDLNQLSYDLYHVTVAKHDHDSIKIDPAYRYISDKKVKLYGAPGVKATVQLSTLDFRTSQLSVDINVSPCPPGFVLNSYADQCTDCVCLTNFKNVTFFGIIYCNQKEKTAILKSGYWIGNSRSENGNATHHIMSGLCPNGFCSYNISYKYLKNTYKLPALTSHDKLEEYICGLNRTGVLCGHCSNGYSAFFHSTTYKCSLDYKCEYGWIFYVLSEIIPITSMFLIIIFFNIQLTAGAVNGFLFFVQFINIMQIEGNGYIATNAIIENCSIVYRFIYGIFNLSFFVFDELSFCLWKGATTLDILAFSYVSVVYSLLLVIITVINVRYFCFRCERKCLRNNISQQSMLHGLTAFLVLCYAQCTKVSLSILTPGYVNTIESDFSEQTSTVVFLKGDISFFAGKHLTYAIPALFFTVIIIIIPPTLLLVYPLCYELFHLLQIEEATFVRFVCKVAPLEKFKPLFDSIQGCFKDKHRYFAGLYFVYRFLALLSYVTLSDSLIKYYTVLEIQLILMLCIQAVVQPYKVNWHNTFETFLLMALAVINSMTLFNLNRSNEYYRASQGDVIIMSAFQLTMIYAPLLVMVILLLKLIFSSLKGKCMAINRTVNKDELLDTLSAVDYREHSALF